MTSMNDTNKASNVPQSTSDYSTQLKHFGSVVKSLELAQLEASKTGHKDVEMIVTAALNLCLSLYYLRMRGEYIEERQEGLSKDAN